MQTIDIEIEGERVRVLEITGRTGFNMLPSYTVAVMWPREDSRVGSTARLWVVDEGNSYLLATVIVREQRIDLKQHEEGFATTFTCGTVLNKLTKKPMRYVVGETLTSAITTVLVDAGLQAEQYEFEVGSDPVYPLRVQHGETDSEFIDRECDERGWLYWIDPTGKLIFTDTVTRLPPGLITGLRDAPLKGLARTAPSITALCEEAGVTPKRLRIESRQIGNPTARWTVMSEGTAAPLVYVNVHDESPGAAEARLRRYERAWQSARHFSRLYTDELRLALGQCLALTHRGQEAQWRIIELQIQGRCSPETPALSTTAHQAFSVVAKVISAEVEYSRVPDRKKVIFNQLLPGVIDSAGDEKSPYLDERGYYRVRFTDNALSYPAGQGSPWVPLMTPNTSPNGGGHHFPLRPGTSVVVGFINGDRSYPFIVGALSSQTEPSVLTRSEAGQHRIQTPAGHHVVMDDNANTLTVGTPASAQTLTLQSGDSPSLAIVSQQGGLTQTAGSHLIDTTQGKWTQSLRGNSAWTVGKTLTVTVGGDALHAATHIERQADKINLKTGGDLTLNATNHHVEGQSGIRIQTAGGLVVRTQQGNIELQSGGALHIKASESLTVAQAGASVTLDKDGNLKLNAKTIRVMGQTLAVNASQVNYQNNGQAGNITAPPMPTYWYGTSTPLHDITTTSPTLPSASDSVARRLQVGQFLDEGDDGFTCHIPNTEIIAINHQPTLPLQKVGLTGNEHLNVANKNTPPLRPQDRYLEVHTLAQPIILDLCTDTPPTALPDTTLNYFKQRGNQIVFFIHGFHVDKGSFAQQIEGVEVGAHTAQEPLFDEPRLQTTTVIPVYNSAPATIYQGFDIIQQRFPEAKNAFPSFDFTMDTVNGTEAHNWLIHMEDNLNRATGQFDRTDYRKYQRIVQVIWPGNVAQPLYLESEERANVAGAALAVILHNILTTHPDMEINVIAHSMGNRVLLTALNQLGAKREYHEKINHVFLWDAAVPDTALSNDPTKDVSPRENCAFIHAMDAVKKVTVLYSKYDHVLKWAYQGANIGYEGLKNEGTQAELNREKMFGEDTVATQQEQIKEQGESVRPALGYSGPMAGTADPIVQRMIDNGKIIRADLSKWAKGAGDSHSYMKIPSDDIMKHGYQKYIIGGKGLNKFGIYDGSKFEADDN